jgi:hypothetical protein
MDAETIAKTLGGRRSAGQWMARCVCPDDKMPSLALRDGEGARLLVQCFAGCDGRDILVELTRRGLLDDSREEHGKKGDRQDSNQRQSTSQHDRAIELTSTQAERAKAEGSIERALQKQFAAHYARATRRG